MIGVALKGLAGRKVRALLTAFAVVIGVSMVSGTFVLTDTMQKAFDGIFTASYEKTDAVIAGKEIVGAGRHGKFLDLDCDGLHLIIHLARAGWLRWAETMSAAPSKPSSPGSGRARCRWHRARPACLPRASSRAPARRRRGSRARGRRASIRRAARNGGRARRSAA